MLFSSSKKSTDSLVDLGNEKMKNATATLPPIQSKPLRAISLVEEDMSKSQSRRSSVGSSHSHSHNNISKVLEMMSTGGGTASRRGSDIRDQRRQSQNVYDAVDLTATLMAMTHSTVDLNATKPIEEILIANFMDKRNSSFSSIETDHQHQLGEDLDVQVYQGYKACFPCTNSTLLPQTYINNAARNIGLLYYTFPYPFP